MIGHAGQRRRKARHEEALLALHHRAGGLRCSEERADLVDAVEQREFECGRHRGKVRGLADRLPEFAQPFDAMFGRVARDQRGIECADRDAGDPVERNAGLVQPFEYAGLVSAERAAALQDERDRFVWQRPRRCRCTGLVSQVRRIDGLLFCTRVRFHQLLREIRRRRRG